MTLQGCIHFSSFESSLWTTDLCKAGRTCNRHRSGKPGQATPWRPSTSSRTRWPGLAAKSGLTFNKLKQSGRVGRRLTDKLDSKSLFFSCILGLKEHPAALARENKWRKKNRKKVEETCCGCLAKLFGNSAKDVFLWIVWFCFRKEFPQFKSFRNKNLYKSCGFQYWRSFVVWTSKWHQQNYRCKWK